MKTTRTNHFGDRGRGTSLSLLNSFLVLAFFFSSAYVEGYTLSAQCVTVPGMISGQVFNDYNADGSIDSGDDGYQGILISAYDDSGSLVSSATSGMDGSWSIGGLSDGDSYRIEFTNIPSGYSSSTVGVDNSSATQFVNVPACDIAFGVTEEQSFCQDDPFIVTPCYVNGSRTGLGPTDVLIRWPYSSSGGPNSPGVYSGPDNVVLATKAQVGSTWGIAYSRELNTLFAAAFLKRHVDLGPNGLGAIYKRPNATGTGTPSLFFDIGQYPGANVGSVSNRNLGNAGSPNNDSDAFAKVGKVGLGDIDISLDGTTLHAVSLADKKLYSIVIDADNDPNTNPTNADVTSVEITDPGCTKGDWRPFALKVTKDGLLIGGICSGDGTGIGQAYILRYDGSSFTEELSFPLDYNRNSQFSGCVDYTWQTWIDVFPGTCKTGAAGDQREYPQPILSDIEIQVDGTMTLGFIDRASHQIGWRNRGTSGTALYRNFANGDILRATLNAMGDYVLEPTPGTNDEFYSGDDFPGHAETAIGGLLHKPGSNLIYSTVYDPKVVFSGGIKKFSTIDGTAPATTSYTVFGSADNSGPQTFGKAAGLGDLEALCSPPPIQLGNYAWIDADGDGIQDPSESPLPNLTVKLYTKAGQLAATTSTDMSGGYHFTDSSTPGETWSGGFTQIEKDSSYFIVFCGDAYDSASGILSVGVDSFLLTTPMVMSGADSELRDSDVEEQAIMTIGTLPAICVTADESNHSYDAGFIMKPSVTLVDTDISCGPVSDGGSIRLELTGGIAPYTYDWNVDTYDGMTNLQNLPVGTYSVVVTDATMCTTTASVDITQEPCVPNPCMSGEMGGTVFNDLDADGVDDADGGFAGVRVQIFACDVDGDSELIETTYTDSMGNYHFSNPAIVDGISYRIEFSNIPDGYTSSMQGTDNGTETQFVDMVSCDIDYGIYNPAEYCSPDPLVAAICFARNNDPTSEPTIIFIKTSDARDWPGPANANDVNGLWGIPSGSNAGNYPLTYVEAANVGEINTTFGMDFDKLGSRLMTGSYMRAYAPMNTNMSANGYAEAALYQIPMNLESASAGTPSLWLDLEDLFGDDFAGTYLPDGTFPGPGVYGRSGSNPDLIGYTGLGSIKISDDRREIYTVNLATREVLVIPIASDGSAPTSAAQIKRFPLPTTDCSGTWPDSRDLRAVLGLGIHPVSGRVYATMTCTGPMLGDVTGYVYSFDPADNTPSSSDFQLELSIPLDIERPATSPNTGRFWNQTAHPWESVTPNSVFYTNDPRTGLSLGNEFNVHHMMPWLGEIEFGQKSDGSYSMIIAERNRYHDQISTSWYVVGGVIYKACGQEGNWTLSNDSNCGAETSVVNFTDSGTRAGAYTDSINRYMMYVGREGSMGSGFMTLARDGESIVSPVMDNLFNSATSGLTWINYSDGGREKDIRILGNYSPAGYNATNFTKANNWGAIASMCETPPLQIGNYAWVDANGDGIQDPCESPVEGLKVKLYSKSSNGSTAILLDSTITSSTGEYYFSDTLTLDSSYYVVFCGDQYNSTDNVIQSDGILYELTTPDTGMGINPDYNDSDASEISLPGIGDLPAICITVDSIDHTLDVGLVPKPDVAVVQVLDPGYDASGVSTGDSVKFKITVFNQSIIDIDSVEVTDYVPAGFTFDPTIAGNAGWTLVGGNPTYVMTDQIDAGDKDSICIYLRLQSYSDVSELINVVEISNAYINNSPVVDCDSPLNTDPNDNGGGAIGSEADDYIDGDGTATGSDGVAATDQDNVDPATIPICDLALINKVSSTVTNLKVGDTVKFDVILENQGTVNATNIKVNYFIPVGFDLTDKKTNPSDPTWALSSGDSIAMVTYTDTLAPGATDTLCVYLELQNVSTDEATLDSWTTIAEIGRYEDPDDPGTAKSDVDSTPDDDFTNDPGGNVDDDTDDETDGDGTGDPMNPTEDEDPTKDEDDHDAAIVYVCDAAAIIYADSAGPFLYGDTIDFKIVVHNQGNDTISNVVINDTLGAGLDFISTTTNTAESWSGDSDTLRVTVTDIIPPGGTDTICLQLELTDVLPYDSTAYLQIIEIESFEDPSSPGVSKSDIDSTPDDDPSNDSGGNPDDTTDDETDGDGTGDPMNPTEDEDPTKDEDDHDPVLTDVFDLALRKVIELDTSYAPGDTATFIMTVYNQGNVDAQSITIADYLQPGYTVSGANNAGWTQTGDTVLYTHSSTLAAGDSVEVSLELIIQIPAMVSGLQDWWNYAEISAADDNNNSGDTPPTDADSTPDDSPDENTSLEPNDANDDVISENGRDGDDEDDHDVARAIVGYDLALKKSVTTAGPYSYGDTLTYTMTVYNQGGLSVSDVMVYDSLPCGLAYSSDQDIAWAHTGGIATYTDTTVIAPGDSATYDLYLIIQRCATPDTNNYLNVAEISDFKDENGDDPTTDDIDSTPDDDPTNDGTPVDDAVTDPTDEDDHDIEDIDICDVALVNRIPDIPTTPSVGDTIKYEVIVYNQGNGEVDSVSIDYDIPIGLTYLPINDGLSPMWSNPSSGEADIVTDEPLAPGESDTVCLYLRLENVSTDMVSEDSWTTVAEITSYQNGDGETKTTDADSTPDDDPTNDPGGSPDDPTDDEVDGDGTGDPMDPSDDTDPTKDEDDHDPAIIYICDASVTIYADIPDTIGYYDTLSYKVIVSNQGNDSITNIKVIDHLPDGFDYITTATNIAEGWAASMSTPDAIETTYSDTLAIGESDTICLDLLIVPVHTGSDSASWLQEIEILSFEDPDAPGVAKHDIDSTPDADPTNDPGGNPDDPTDDEDDGDGTGDPNDPMEDTDPTKDEDDHDPVDTKVLDLALMMRIDSMPPVLPVVPGDEMKFIIVVTNQGNTPVNDIEITNHLMDENLMLSSNMGNANWTMQNSVTNTQTILGELAPGETDTVCIYLEVVTGAMSDIITYAEISGSTETDGVCYDIDSTPDGDNTNDPGGTPQSDEDNHIEDDGSDGNDDGIVDEDDHDPAMLDLQDLALIIWADQKDPVQVGDHVKFRIRVINQGNIINDTIDLVDYIPTGLELSAVDSFGWTLQNDSTATKTIVDPLAPGDTLETCILLTVRPQVDALDLINYAEISRSVGLGGLDLSTLDVDSRPDADRANDTGGQYEDLPDCSTDPIVINDDNNLSESGVSGDDEDDHDPAWVHVLDLASIIYTDQTLPVIPGDDVKFNVVLLNQGNVAATDIQTQIYLPGGFALSPSDTSGWASTGTDISHTYADTLLPFTADTICVVLEVQPGQALGGMIPVVEIASVRDTLGNDQSDDDLDSSPNTNGTDDEGGQIFTPDDDRVTGTGISGDDEDDHDPAVPPVLDLAVNIVTVDPTPKEAGDTVKFMVTVYNQGSITPQEFTIDNYVPEGLEYIDAPLNVGWTPLGATDASFNYTDTLSPSTSDTMCIYLKLAEIATPLNVVNMVEISEVIDTMDRDVSLLDIDSEADGDNGNDVGNDLYSIHDDKLFENGRSGFDQDDHDQAYVILCNEGLTCLGRLNISLSEICSGSILPSMLLRGDKLPNRFYDVEVYNSAGQSIPNEFGSENIDQSYKVAVTNRFCGSTCWSDVTIEYKHTPKINCVPNDTLYCFEAFSTASHPTLASGCLETELIMVEESIEALDCHPDFSAMVTRQWIARDERGQTSEACSQTLYIARLDLGMVIPPADATVSTGRALMCGADFELDADGYPAPSEVGVPSIVLTNGDTLGLYPLEAKTLCNAFADYSDVELLSPFDCVRKISRTWTVGEIWCTRYPYQTFVQMIEITDLAAPTVTCPDDIIVGDLDAGCHASISIPLPDADDLCSGSDLLYTLQTPVGTFEDYEGAEIPLPVGVHTLTYQVFDGCHNMSECSFTVTVQDSTAPVALCLQYIDVSMSTESNTYVSARELDNGSYDACGTITMSIARMYGTSIESAGAFGDRILIDCEDTEEGVMALLRVTDDLGNTNHCMVRISVVDKIPATMGCLDDMTVECDYSFDETALASHFGSVEIYDNCANQNTIIDTILSDTRNSCGVGMVVRHLSLRDAQGDLISECQQRITFEGERTLDYDDITPPTPVIEIVGCDEEEIEIDGPRFPEDICSLPSVVMESDTFYAVADEITSCFKVYRTYTVIDYCITSGPGSALEPWTFEQIIKVSDLDRPVIADLFARDTTYCVDAGDCEALELSGITATASDICTPTDLLVNTYEVRDHLGQVIRSGSGLDASGSYGIGSYTVTFISEDQCGNVSSTSSEFRVISCHRPITYCRNGLSTTLGAMDLDADGEPDAEIVTVTPDQIDGGSEHPCGMDIVLSFSPDIYDTTRTFSCADTAELQPIELWVTPLDIDGNPLYDLADFCRTMIDIEDNNDVDLCFDASLLHVRGQIYNSASVALQDVDIELQSDQLMLDKVDEEQLYGFLHMPPGGAYELTPYKDDDVLQGVSTHDLLLMQMHILGIRPLDNPYQWIAADIDSDERITIKDLVHLRRVLLGVDEKYRNNTSWRFIHDSHRFDPVAGPWAYELPESYRIDALHQDMWIDFIGIKIGDLSGQGLGQTRSSRHVELRIPDIHVRRGQTYEIPVMATSAMDLRGMQYDLATDGIEVIDIIPGRLSISRDNYRSTEEHFTLSYQDAEGLAVLSDERLYTIVVRAEKDGKASDYMHISSQSLAPEVYLSETAEVGTMSITWEHTHEERMTVDRLSPNPWSTYAKIHVDLPRAGQIKLIVRDVTGKILLSREQRHESGPSDIIITDDELSAIGVFYYEIHFENDIVHRKMIKVN